MKITPHNRHVHVEDRTALAHEITRLISKGNRAAAVFHTIRLGMSDGHQNRPDTDCPIPQPDLREIWKKNRDIGRANSKKASQPDLLAPLLGVERQDDDQTLNT